MARKVIWTAAAWVDLEETADYIAQDSMYYGAAFVREIRDAARSLRQFAKRGRIVPELGSPDIRELWVRSYRLVYKVSNDTVIILAFIHGARDLPSLWEKRT
ncbi:MAG TPA: type II toxin-antitoxin system RelE/ParE family toxin [bacterium]